MTIRLSLAGRAYHQWRLPERLELPAEADLTTALAALGPHLGDRPLPASCLVSVNGQHVGAVGRYDNRPLRDGDELLLLAPVAGG